MGGTDRDRGPTRQLPRGVTLIASLAAATVIAAAGCGGTETQEPEDG